MKKSIVSLAFIILLIGECLCQHHSSKLNIIPSEYDTSHQKPMGFAMGDTIVIKCDSVYILNTAKLNLYKKISDLYINEGDANCMKLLELSQLSLKEREDNYNKLSDKCKEADSISFNMIGIARSNLMKTQETLEYTQKTLDYTISSLEQTSKLLKKEKREKWFERFMIGIGSGGIGILVGILVAR